MAKDANIPSEGPEETSAELSHEITHRSNKGVAVITGGSAGIGRAVARQLADEGYDIVVIARGEERLQDTIEELGQMGVNAAYYCADVADADEIEAAAQFVEDEIGEISVWVNNAMTTLIARFDDMSAKDMKRIMDVNYLGQVNGLHAALKRMKPRNKGTVVNIGSGLAYRAIPLQSAYCASKHAVKALSEAVRTELINENSKVHIAMVQPPGVNTPQFSWAKAKIDKQPKPVAPIYQPETIARAVSKAINGQHREVLVGRPTLQMMVGEMLSPLGLDHMLSKKAVKGQKSNQPVGAIQQEGNLYAPVEMDVAAHGDYDKTAKSQAIAVDGDKARLVGALAGAAVFGLIGYALARNSGGASRAASGIIGEARNRLLQADVSDIDISQRVDQFLDFAKGFRR